VSVTLMTFNIISLIIILLNESLIDATWQRQFRWHWYWEPLSLPINFIKSILIDFVILFSLYTHINRFLIILVHVVDKGQIIVSVKIKRINLNAEFEMLNCLGVLLKLKVGNTQCVMQLPAALYFYNFLTPLECFNRLLVMLHLI
jgi:hypothetical protein